MISRVEIQIVKTILVRVWLDTDLEESAALEEAAGDVYIDAVRRANSSIVEIETVSTDHVEVHKCE